MLVEKILKVKAAKDNNRKVDNNRLLSKIRIVMPTLDKATEFISGSLMVKIKEDLKNFRIFNKGDLLSVAYYHSRRFFLTLPGWQLRINPDLKGKKPDLVVLQNDEIQALLQFEFALVPKQFRYFPKVIFEEKAAMLKSLLAVYKDKKIKGWLFGIYDTDEAVFYPTLTDKTVASQLSFLSINVREFQDYAVWRKRWDELKEKVL